MPKTAIAEQLQQAGITASHVALDKALALFRNTGNSYADAIARVNAAYARAGIGLRHVARLLHLQDAGRFAGRRQAAGRAHRPRGKGARRAPRRHRPAEKRHRPGREGGVMSEKEAILAMRNTMFATGDGMSFHAFMLGSVMAQAKIAVETADTPAEATALLHHYFTSALQALPVYWAEKGKGHG